MGLRDPATPLKFYGCRPEHPAEDDEKVPSDLLDFDPENPRLVEDATKNPTEAQIISALAETADLSEVVESIASNGYFDIEPLIVQRVKDRFRVLEGNRRLAAIRLLQKPTMGKTVGINVPEISQEVADSIKEVTVYAVENAAQARDYIGFKHINGPHRWDALAKARFGAAGYRKERKNGVTLEKIAQRLGDRHDTVVRLVNGVFVLDQAEAAIQAGSSRSPIFIPRSRGPATGNSLAFRKSGAILTRCRTRFLWTSWRTFGTFSCGFTGRSRTTFRP